MSCRTSTSITITTDHVVLSASDDLDPEPSEVDDLQPPNDIPIGEDLQAPRVRLRAPLAVKDHARIAGIDRQVPLCEAGQYVSQVDCRRVIWREGFWIERNDVAGTRGFKRPSKGSWTAVGNGGDYPLGILINNLSHGQVP